MADHSRQYPSFEMDKGYAWVICAGAFLYFFLHGGYIKCYGFFLVEYMNLFSKGPTQTAWMGVFFGINEALFATLGGYLGTGSYARPVVVMCGILSAGLCVAAGYAPHLYLVIISYGLLGVTTALTYPAIYGSLAKHFSQRRCLAYGIAMSGESIGNLTFPLVINHLLEVYTIRGTMVIIGGCMLHVCLCGMLLRNNAPLKGNISDQTKDKIYIIPLPQRNGNINVETSNIPKTDLETDKKVKEISHPSPPCSDVHASQITNVLLYKELLCNMEIIALTVCCLLCWTGAVGSLMIVPLIMSELGYATITSTILMVVYGSVELSARPIFGWVSDKSQLTRSILFPTLQLILGCGAIVISFLASLQTMVVLCVLVGICGTSFLSFMGPFYADTVGPQNSSKTGSLVNMTGGMFFVIFNSIIGVIKERTNTYLMSLTLCGCCSVAASGILWTRLFIIMKKKTMKSVI